MIALGILLGSFPEVMWLWCALFGSFGLALGRASVGCLFAWSCLNPLRGFTCMFLGLLSQGCCYCMTFSGTGPASLDVNCEEVLSNH